MMTISTKFLLAVVVVGAALISSATTCDATKHELSHSDIDQNACVSILTNALSLRSPFDNEKICDAVVDGRLGADIPSCVDRLTIEVDILDYALFPPVADLVCSLIKSMLSNKLRLASS
ncbi:hypothetical protein TorRG33x02_122820 [Trema orientale]|uniref:Pectinesterase inhibitor domain containing protein n=1 Tax=Trema orientale TaxID=63057 RepID=A0A2P5F2E0_TREOI|nr:hypothetical protein TorRG33x02_122820 [Trema orientale]